MRGFEPGGSGWTTPGRLEGPLASSQPTPPSVSRLRSIIRSTRSRSRSSAASSKSSRLDRATQLLPQIGRVHAVRSCRLRPARPRSAPPCAGWNHAAVEAGHGAVPRTSDSTPGSRAGRSPGSPEACRRSAGSWPSAGPVPRPARCPCPWPRERSRAASWLPRQGSLRPSPRRNARRDAAWSPASLTICVRWMTASRSRHWSHDIRASTPRRATSTSRPVLQRQHPVGASRQGAIVGHDHQGGLDTPGTTGQTVGEAARCFRDPGCRRAHRPARRADPPPGPGLRRHAAARRRRVRRGDGTSVPPARPPRAAPPPGTGPRRRPLRR